MLNIYKKKIFKYLSVTDSIALAIFMYIIVILILVINLFLFQFKPSFGGSKIKLYIFFKIKS